MLVSLKKKTVSGFKWQIVLQVAAKGLSVVTFAFLARILDPSVFGLFALAFVAIDGLSLFKSFGIDAGLIQRKEDSEEVRSTAFWLVMVSGFLMGIFCLAAAPLAAAFFKNPEAQSVIQALALVFVINGFGKVPSALLTRQMRFRTISLIQLAGGCVNSAAAVGFALISPSIWSLVWAYLIKTAVMDVLSWKCSGFRLKFIFSKSVARDFWSYGSVLMAGGIARFLTENLNAIAVGRMLDTTKVGYLALANNVASFINTHFTYLILRVLFPAYASVQDDPSELKRIYLKVLKYICYFTVPFCAALALLAHDLVLTLYGEKWLLIVPVMQAACAVQLLASISCGAGPVFMACGRPKYALHVTLAGLALRIPLLIVMTRAGGLMGAVCSDLAVNLILLPMNAALVKKSVPFRWSEFVTAILPAASASACMAVGLVLGGWFAGSTASGRLENSPLLRLLFGAAVGGSAYAASLWCFHRQDFFEIIRLIFRSEGKTLSGKAGV
ncbi:MAG: lipopolysaccharide biosynthesis protein [Candidatus Omnitrophica bacterium]|nr:lipopolysaccharide biosynthesis protein [Candidatus Omnitrophota bacterium]